MAVQMMSKSRFDALVDTRDPIAQVIAEERAWFASDSEKILGAVVFDRSDKDWAYVILERAEDGRFRWVEGNVSIDSLSNATEELKKAMEARAANKK